ncbi:MAG TPA: ribose-phosphate pyrophosphokinase-like domain-containing protein, partial [Longimicrobiaceae bacterium]|nr:ribose-phosphate pyrophosphokinase-like domain-containing protein [Longimicrobiaceae bacterium]
MPDAFNTGSMMLLGGSANLPLAQEIAEKLGMPLGEVTIKRFADDELFVRIDENVRGRDLYIIQPTCPPG